MNVKNSAFTGNAIANGAGAAIKRPYFLIIDKKVGNIWPIFKETGDGSETTEKHILKIGK